MKALLFSILAVFAGSDSAVLAEIPDQPYRVLIGRDGPENDACGAVGKIGWLDPQSDASLAVRGDPSLTGMEQDRLEPGTLVWLCDAQDEWQGIVYPTGNYQDLGDCRVGTPIAEPQAYGGPCRAGWIEGKYIHLVAG